MWSALLMGATAAAQEPIWWVIDGASNTVSGFFTAQQVSVVSVLAFGNVKSRL